MGELEHQVKRWDDYRKIRRGGDGMEGGNDGERQLELKSIERAVWKPTAVENNIGR